jgi:DNA-binding MarR family transcriptional regulator
MLSNVPTTIATLELASELRVSLMRLVRRLRAERSAVGLSLTQRSVLGCLDRGGAMSLGEIAAHERVQPPSMTRTTAALEEQGLIARSADPNDKRRVVFELTTDGRQLLHDDRRRREAWLAGQLDSLTDDELSLLRAAAPLIDRIAQS